MVGVAQAGWGFAVFGGAAAVAHAHDEAHGFGVEASSAATAAPAVSEASPGFVSRVLRVSSMIVSGVLNAGCAANGRYERALTIRLIAFESPSTALIARE